MYTPSVSIRNASCAYHGQTLFKNLSLHLPAGQWTCILGPSGIGKTSLLRLLAGLMKEKNDAMHMSAQIETSDGQPVEGRLAYLTQHDALLPWFSVADNVGIGNRLRGARSPSDQQRIKQLLKDLGLEAVADKKPNALSGGMRQRVAIARLLFEDKPIVLLDEPFTALDVPTRLALQNVAHDTLRGCTVLLVTHDPLEALRLGDHIYIMSGSPAVIHASPTLTSPAPRSPSDLDLLRAQAALLDELQAAKETLSC